MRFADVDVMGLGNGSAIPPLEVRVDLRPGDKVGLYQEVRHASMGAGYAPLEAIVLGSPEPGWFIGETEDGREVTFHAGNVADVQFHSPSMGGFLDFFKKIVPPLPGSQQPVIALPPPALPKPEEKKGLVAQIKSLFTVTETTEKKSIFDVFKKKEAPAGLPAQVEKKVSMFSVLSPESKVVVPFSKQVSDIAVPKGGPSVLAPYVEKFKEAFKIIPTSPEPVYEETKQELFANIFKPEAAQAEERGFGDIFKVFTPEEIQPTQEVVMPPNLPKRMHRDMNIMPLPRRTTLLPSVEDVARGFISLYTASPAQIAQGVTDTIDDLWNMLREKRSRPIWEKRLKEQGFAKEPLESLGTCGGPPSAFEELSTFFHIPWEEFRSRAEIRVLDEEREEWIDDERIWMEIVFPSSELLTEAFELIKPEDLPGKLVLEREKHGNHFCMLTLTYIEEAQGGVQEYVREEQALSPEEVVAQLKKDDIDPRQAIAELEAEIFDLVKQFESLDPDSGTYQDQGIEITNQIEYRKAIVREIVQEMSEEPEESKRKPSKKEPPDLETLIKDLEESIVTEEKGMAELFRSLESLNLKDPAGKDLAAELKRSMEEGRKSLQKLTKELSKLVEVKESQEEEGGKRQGKRGKKKGK